VLKLCRLFCATANPTEVIVPRPTRVVEFWAWWTGPRPRASRARTTSPGGKGSFGRSATSCEPGRRPSGLLRGPHLDRHHDRFHIGAAAVRATHLGVLVVLGEGLLVVERPRALLAAEFVERHGWSSVRAGRPVPGDPSLDRDTDTFRQSPSNSIPVPSSRRHTSF